MRIYSMTATFGKLEHQTLTLQPGLNIIHAPNEWGKSTWCAFLVAMLYGIETRVHSTKTVLADKERYAPWSGSPMSGRIDLCWQGRDITIERQTKGRSIFGQFKAYETQTGLDIPELTATNCGEVLLGVEKSVFTRAGFLKLTDLPVTEDKALWRRLNALVTTGDESGAADALAQKLRDLKNRCRANRANGLIPQAQTQKEEIEAKLRQLHQFQAQARQIRERQESLESHAAQLKNHKDALEYEAARDHAQKAAAARYHVEEAQRKVEQLQAVCAQLPPSENIYPALAQLQQLQQQRDALQMELQMQPEAPAAPDVPGPFRGCAPEQAVEQAREDARLYTQCRDAKPTPSTFLFILGLVIMGTGLVSLVLMESMLLPLILLTLGAVGTVAGLLRYFSAKQTAQQLENRAQALLDRYRPLPPDRWEQAAEDYAQAQLSYSQAAQQHRQGISHIRESMEDIHRQLTKLTGGVPALQWEQTQRAALEQHNALSNALREQKQAQAVYQALSADRPQPAAPRMPDTLTYTMAETLRLLSDTESSLHQLQHQLGHCRGQMESLGREETLEQQLQQVNARLQKLEQTYAALELAQQTLTQASAELQRRFAPRISQRAQALFGRLTGNRYDRVVLGSDMSLSAGAQEENTLRSSLWRSDGTVDQLYLALRLAVAEELTPNAPLILDDALVRFDDDRLAKAMAILKEAAKDKQILLFTCQSRETEYLQSPT